MIKIKVEDLDKMSREQLNEIGAREREERITSIAKHVFSEATATVIMGIVPVANADIDNPDDQDFDVKHGFADLCGDIITDMIESNLLNASDVVDVSKMIGSLLCNFDHTAVTRRDRENALMSDSCVINERYLFPNVDA